MLYQRSRTKKLSHAAPRTEDPSPGTRRPVDEKAERPQGVGAHLARLEEQRQQLERARERAGQLLEASE